MRLISRRAVLAASGTVAAALALGKPRHGGAAQMAGLAALKFAEPPEEVPEITFTDAGQSEHRLSEFRGRGAVVNLWATWCQPCVAEMPSLAKLAAALKDDRIAVLPLSSDRGGVARVQRFFTDHGITGLPILIDPNGAATRAFDARGLPTTILIDTQGRERARLEGPADWSSDEAAQKVRSLVL